MKDSNENLNHENTNEKLNKQTKILRKKATANGWKPRKNSQQLLKKEGKPQKFQTSNLDPMTQIPRNFSHET